jgi:hypothetical protein
VRWGVNALLSSRAYVNRRGAGIGRSTATSTNERSMNAGGGGWPLGFQVELQVLALCRLLAGAGERTRTMRSKEFPQTPTYQKSSSAWGSMKCDQ